MYNISQLQEALLRADAVGDVESARLFAAEIQELQQPAPQPEQTPLDLEPYLDSLQGVLDTQRTAFGRGLSSGLDTMEQFYGSATEGVGRSLGLEGLEEYGAEIALANEADVQRAAKNSIRNVSSTSRRINWGRCYCGGIRRGSFSYNTFFLRG